MALVLADRVRDTTTTTGTGTVTLSGTAPTGYQNFSVVGNGNTTYYTINAGSQFEVGIGTYSSTGPTLARTTILSSSNGGAAVDFAAGTKDVFVTYPSGKSVNYDASNNVGIGTTTPSYKLDVSGGDIRLATNATYIRSVTTGGTNVRMLGINAGNVAYVGPIDSGPVSAVFNASPSSLTTAFYTSGTERMRIDSSGNVGIGTSAQTVKLQVISDGAPAASGNMTTGMMVASGIGSFALNMGANSTGGYTWINSAYTNNSGIASPMVFMTGASERMRITSSGSVGIGKTPAFGLLDVNGAVFATDDGTYSFGRNNGTNSGGWKFDSTNPSIVTYVGNGSERMRIDSSGNVTITNKIIPNVQSVASAATITPNADTNTQVSVTALAVPATIASPTGTPSDGQSLVIRIEDDGTARALTWTTGSSGAYRAVGITLPTTTVAAKVVYIGCKYNSTDLRWDAIALSQEA
jgi:hypothetical protein